MEVFTDRTNAAVTTLALVQAFRADYMNTE